MAAEAKSSLGLFKKAPKKLTEKTELQLRVYLCELHDLKKEVQSSPYNLGFFAGIIYGEKRYPSQAAAFLNAIDSAINDIKKIKSPEEITQIKQHLQNLSHIATKWRNSVPGLKQTEIHPDFSLQPH